MYYGGLTRPRHQILFEPLLLQRLSYITVLILITVYIFAAGSCKKMCKSHFNWKCFVLSGTNSIVTNHYLVGSLNDFCAKKTTWCNSLLAANGES